MKLRACTCFVRSHISVAVCNVRGHMHGSVIFRKCLWLIACYAAILAQAQPFVAAAMAADRAKCLLTEEACNVLVKSHVKSLDDDVWKNDDMEIVIGHHLSLLVAISQHTARLKTSLLEKVLLTVLSCSPTVAHNFSLKMSQCLQYCVSKAGSATSGKKLSNGVKAVVLAMHNGPASVQKLRSSLGSSGAAASSSSGLPVRIPSNEVEEVVEDTPMEAAVGWDKESILKMYGVGASPPKRRCLRKEDSVVSVASSAVMEAVPPADHGSQAEPADAAVGVGGEALATSIIRIILTIGGKPGGILISFLRRTGWTSMRASCVASRRLGSRRRQI